MATPDLFDAYFMRADVDRDGRISGQEAVSFFQGANLHREVLAKVWQYADKGQTGFLSRLEFYNALKLVTVAQSGRELTPALVSKALSEPAASQIPAPQIQMSLITNSMNPQAVGSAMPVQPPIAPGQQQYSAGPLPQGTQPTISPQLLRAPTLPTPSVSANVSSDWPANKSSSWPGPGSINNPGIHLPQTATTTPAQDLLFQGTSPVVNPVATPKSTVEPDLFGGDVFTAVPTKPQIATGHGHSKGLAQSPQLSLTVLNQPPQPRGLQTSGQPDIASLEIVPASSAPPSIPPRQLQGVVTPAGRAERGFAAPVPAMDRSKQWPKMTDADVRRFTKVFFDVDTDKDGKISGAQARDLFLSWKLPREVLKQVWDLSDQDHDSMLSLHEFCVALYLMERHRDGSALPATISPAFYFDETGLQALRLSEAQVAVPQNSAGHNMPAWRHHSGVIEGDYNAFKRGVFRALRNHKLVIDAKKSEFFLPEIHFLGHIVSAAGVQIDSAKIEAIRNWPDLKNVHEVRSFLGLCSYYWRYVRKFAEIASPLHMLTQKGVFFSWGATEVTAFQTLKDKMTTGPILILPDLQKSFEVYCDACGRSLGAILMREGRVIAYESRLFSKPKMTAQIYEKELLAVIYALTQWRHYLLGADFTVFTDHQSLRFFLSQKQLSEKQMRWANILSQFYFQIVHVQGQTNVVADALSRKLWFRLFPRYIIGALGYGMGRH
ncbi:hypothetical protein L7F22_015194 [Adiantum nelumboides]|nr:hypothetical protein [Adiantum nelumboides]